MLSTRKDLAIIRRMLGANTMIPLVTVGIGVILSGQVGIAADRSGPADRHQPSRSEEVRIIQHEDDGGYEMIVSTHGDEGEKAASACYGYVLDFYRYWSSSATDHFYTTNFNELGWGAGGYTYEGIEVDLFDANSTSCGFVPLYRYFNSYGGDHFYTTTRNDAGYAAYGYTYENIPGYCYPKSTSDLIPLYQYFNPTLTDHFYTRTWMGSTYAGWNYERIACYVLKP